MKNHQLARLLLVSSATLALLTSAAAQAEDPMMPGVVVVGSQNEVLCWGLGCMDLQLPTGVDIVLDSVGFFSRAPRSVATVQDMQSTCGTDMDVRAARANYAAGAHRHGARPGDTITVVLADGRQETWRYVQGGPLSAGTIIAGTPVSTQCQ